MEPLERPMREVLGHLGLGLELRLAPRNQVFQVLADPGGPFAGGGDLNVVVVRLASIDPDELAASVVASAERTGVAHLVVCVPDRGGFDTAGREAWLAARLAGRPGVAVLTEAERASCHPGVAPWDLTASVAMEVPFAPHFYASLAQLIARRAAGRVLRPPKALVVDADGTLWDGVVGEDGVDGVVVGPRRRAFQQFLLGQRAAGRLLCLCSANDEADVLEVLRHHPDMVLRPEHLTAHRVNWAPKPGNLSALAVEIDFNTDDLVFLDDSPLECAKVQAALPGVTVVELPPDPAAAVATLERCWPLDLGEVTDDDRHRADRYRVERDRTATLTAARSLDELIASLRLEVDIRPLRSDDLDRATQLVLRTNQFNLSGVRRTRSDLGDLPASHEAFVVSARDRFGDYGMVGVVVATATGGALQADTFVLSCRAMGRGVEHHLVRELGRLAAERDLAWVDLAYRPAPRNTPALAFCLALGAERREHDGGREVFRLAAAAAAEVTYLPSRSADRAGDVVGAGSPARPTADHAETVGSADLTATADTGWGRRWNDDQVLHDPAALLALLAATPTGTTSAGADAASNRSGPGSGNPTPTTAATPPGRPRAENCPVVTDDPVEAAVARIWTELLDFAPTTVDDDFYALGGDSMNVIDFSRRVRAELGVELSLDRLFTDDFTIASMAATIRSFWVAADADAGVSLSELLDELQQLDDDEVERELGWR